MSYDDEPWKQPKVTELTPQQRSEIAINEARDMHAFRYALWEEAHGALRYYTAKENMIAVIKVFIVAFVTLVSLPTVWRAGAVVIGVFAVSGLAVVAFEWMEYRRRSLNLKVMEYRDAHPTELVIHS